MKTENATKHSFMIREAIPKKGTPLFDREFIKHCLGIFASVACPDKQSIVDKTSLSHQTVARREDDLATNIKSRLMDCQYYSLALGESTDISDTAQLAIFVRGVNQNFEEVEELLDLRPMN
ncbi:General transcription factor II-I repeat domain-containing protein 2A [Holothuria leucospilota]|uniref:General transcription factor II-I repeat domain-containing protein 2A n=1 Tax=Holothuria leucospilota TaxID=206669 RepID=A0A9Q1CNR9_HOLLE|nr:General transcription factor II-I repeat domain-containing protein 2A [Holothuria leucospilota]